MLQKRGYREERRERFWELDLTKNKDRIEKMTDASRAKMREQGIQILTVAHDHDPEKLQKLHRMSSEAGQDVPTTVPHVEPTFEEFMDWQSSPGLRQDRMWIAREGDDILGVSQLSFPPVRGVVQTDWTGMARKARGRGIARALKLETLMQAMVLGIDRVRTDNDSTNAPILHLNESMGYERRADMVQFLKEL
jgi:RimJ/RimL family protein N-acetyltransferase